MKLQSEELQIHAEEITDIRKEVERERLTRESLEKRLSLHRKGSHHRLSSEAQKRSRYNGTSTKRPGKNTNDTVPEPTAGGSKPYVDSNTNGTSPEDVNSIVGNRVDNTVRELTIQHKTTISELNELKSKITASLSEHHDMRRNIDELKTGVSNIPR